MAQWYQQTQALDDKSIAATRLATAASGLHGSAKARKTSTEQNLYYWCQATNLYLIGSAP